MFTTRADSDVLPTLDLVKRVFRAERPDAFWMTHLPYLLTRSAMA